MEKLIGTGTEIGGDTYLAMCILELQAMRRVLEESNASSLEKAVTDAKLLLAEGGKSPNLIPPYRKG